jgi:8-oxo-dGTP pyrophosphatase MutT (NUDIX family)
MQREFSAGGVLVRRLAGRWMLAAIRPGGRPEGLWALPKGRIDPGERAEETALREVAEETGARGRSLGKLGDTRYVFTWDGERIFKIVSFFLIRYEGGRLGDVRYVYTWEGERIFKVVSFFLVRYEGGRLADLTPEYRHEVAEVRWLPLE